jgi:nitrogen-specific signal transduction histidine kinase/CheY-like chemotaxis protein
MEIRCKDGTKKIISWHNISGRFPIRGWTSWAIGVDITERKQLEEERLDAGKLKAIRVLAGGFAHDFNNLLTGILGNIQLAKMYMSSDKKALPKLEKAEKVSLETKELITQLQTFYKAEEPVRKTVPIAELVKEAVETILTGSSIKCRYFILEDLWLTKYDPEQIRHVINSLVLNARDAMPQGGSIEVGLRNVSLSKEQALSLNPGDYIEISVRDHGVGIPEEHLDKIFDLYFSTKPKGADRGVGWGLAIARSIIKNHGGGIGARSKVGVGTIFYIYLPAVKKEIHIEEKIPFKGKGKILLVDDKEIIREVCAGMLMYLGYEVELAGNGAEAIEKYKDSKECDQPYDAVILDLAISGGMGAIETIKELIKTDSQVRAIVSSGYPNNSVISDFKEYGFKGAVTKPYEIVELSKILNEVIA